MNNPLSLLSLPKYARLLPRLFPASDRLEIRDADNALVWSWPDAKRATHAEPDSSEPWNDNGRGLERRSLGPGRTQIRAPIGTRGQGAVGWLVVAFDTSVAVPVDTAPELLKNSFTDAMAILQDEIELQVECNQLAVELTERYEELNLVYATDDRIEHVEEGHEALAQLVRNCTDYLDVGLAALICRDRGIELHNIEHSAAPTEPLDFLKLFKNQVYTYVESQLESVVVNELDRNLRKQVLGNRTDNMVACPIMDDHGTAIGILAVAAPREQHTFSNGDRNLLEVMSKKASRIIHTHHDSLTGLINRSGFESLLLGLLRETRNGSDQHCLLHINIGQLHVVNDLLGYQEGDALIRRVAKCLQARLRDSDKLARLGGDEFAILLARCPLDKGLDIARALSRSVGELEVISGNRRLNVSISIGVASLSRETDSVVSLLAAAEIACKTASENGRDQVEVFQADNTTLLRRSEEVEWMGRIQEALRSDTFELYCQPVVPVEKDQHSGHFEILLRMLDEDAAVLSPAVFMPAAERYQMMPMIDRWVIRNALRQLGEQWQQLATARPVFCINLSGQSLASAGLYAFIIEELKTNRVPPQSICFEVTETAAIANIDEAIAFMDSLRGIGCRFSLDDFGAGLSSFGYLKTLPVDYLKIDGSIVREILTDRISRSMVQAITDIGKTMGLSVVAEFVENEEILTVLRSIGVDFGQGYGLGKPEPLRRTLAAVRNGLRSHSA